MNPAATIIIEATRTMEAEAASSSPLVDDANATDPVCILSPHKKRVLSLTGESPQTELVYRS